MLKNFPILKRLNLNTEFGKNVFTLFTGTTIAQIIPFVVSPVLTRIYSPDDFGLLALFVSVFSLISILVTLQYESAIVLPREDRDAANIVALCLLITICVTTLSSAIVGLLNKSITEWIGDERISFWLYFVPIPVFLTGVYNTFNYWATRKKQYKRLAARTISQSFSTALLKVVFGFFGVLKSGLILGTILGQLTATTVLSWLTWNDDKRYYREITKTRIVEQAKAHINFPKYTAWQGFFDIFNVSLTSFLISSYFGSIILGLYSFTLGLLQKPLQLIGSSVAQVYYQKASELYRNGYDIWPITKKILYRLSFIAVLIFTPIAFWGPQLFSFVFGENWSEAGYYAQVFLPWLVMKFIFSPVTSSFSIISEQKKFFMMTLIINLFFPTFLYIAFNNGISFILSLFVVSIISSLYYFVIIIWLKKLVKRNIKDF